MIQKTREVGDAFWLETRNHTLLAKVTHDADGWHIAGWLPADMTKAEVERALSLMYGDGGPLTANNDGW